MLNDVITHWIKAKVNHVWTQILCIFCPWYITMMITNFCMLSMKRNMRGGHFNRTPEQLTGTHLPFGLASKCLFRIAQVHNSAIWLATDIAEPHCQNIGLRFLLCSYQANFWDPKLKCELGRLWPAVEEV